MQRGMRLISSRKGWEPAFARNHSSLLVRFVFILSGFISKHESKHERINTIASNCPNGTANFIFEHVSAIGFPTNSIPLGTSDLRFTGVAPACASLFSIAARKEASVSRNPAGISVASKEFQPPWTPNNNRESSRDRGSLNDHVARYVYCYRVIVSRIENLLVPIWNLRWNPPRGRFSSARLLRINIDRSAPIRRTTCRSSSSFTGQYLPLVVQCRNPSVKSSSPSLPPTSSAVRHTATNHRPWIFDFGPAWALSCAQERRADPRSSLFPRERRVGIAPFLSASDRSIDRSINPRKFAPRIFPGCEEGGRHKRCALKSGRRKKKSERSASPGATPSLFLSSFLLLSSAPRRARDPELAPHDAPTGPGKRLTRMANHSLGAPPLRHLAP